jgi:hypothetical protein
VDERSAVLTPGVRGFPAYTLGDSRKEDDVSRFANEFSWSKSRDELFRECRRKYYYDKYGSWGGWEEGADERIRALYVAKNLKSRHMWVGEVVHRTVENILRALRSGVRKRAEEALEEMTGGMRRDFRESREGRYRKNPKRFCGLFEHEYDIPVKDEEWFRLHEKARACILHFMGSEILDEIKQMPENDWLTLEGLLEFRFEGTKIYLKMDFASRVDGGILIVDWKTGEKDDVDSNVQLSCYGLFAVEEWGFGPGEVTTVEYNLSSKNEKRSTLVPANLDWVKHYIRSSTAAMKQLLYNPALNQAREEDFPFTDNDLSCTWCQFKALCRKFN